MTTLPSLFTEEIFIKGKPLRLDDLTTVENNVITINATIAGLTGVKPSSDNSGETIRSRPPTSQDDVNENWYVADIWIADKAYVCMDNSENAAVWKVASLEIDDANMSYETAYSSSRIYDEMKSNTEFTNYKLSLKANISDVNTLLSSKASLRQLTMGLFHKQDIGDCYLKSESIEQRDLFYNLFDGRIIETNNLIATKENVGVCYTKDETDGLFNNNKIALNNLSDRVYSKTETDALIKINTDSDKRYKDLMVITVNDIESGLDSKADKDDTYTNIKLKLVIVYL